MKEINNCSAMLLCDFYKISHREQYPSGTENVYSTWIPRASRLEDIKEVVAFGFQAFIKKYLIQYFNENFFNRPLQDVLSEYIRVIKFTLGVENPDVEHITNLHKLGYLPIKIKALEEGTLVPLRIPMLTIENTIPEFYWVTNYLETLASSELWMPTTAATIAYQYRKILTHYAEETNGDISGVQFQGHDFSMRGMNGLEGSSLSGMGHLLSFVGTDSIPSIVELENYYNADIENELVGCSIPATEHSVMCAYGRDEFNSYKRIITEVYPNGFVSIVSDTWDLWSVISSVIKPLKSEILARDGKVVIRPDSGDPVKIICGDPDIVLTSRSTPREVLESKGVVEALWDIFGGVITDRGYKQLDSHIGCIYGEAITYIRCEEICKKLMAKGFASTNMVYGIGSFTYQYNTRDTFGFALKSTSVVINGKEIKIYKDPMTDKDHLKKSLTGRCVVWKEADGSLRVTDSLTSAEQDAEKDNDLLKDIFVDGKLIIDDSLYDIRGRLLNKLDICQ